jgi:rhodanese-related sulfurtransferase
MAMKIGYQQLIDDAMAEITTLSPEQAQSRLGSDDVVFVDIRDIRELQREGRIPGAFHATRGMLEFWVDPDSPYHKPVFAEAKQFIFYCQSGWRSALATQAVQRMGMDNVCHIGGGFRAWKDSGAQVEELPAKS